MKLIKMLRNLKWLAVWTATWTMLISPVAMGQEAKRVSRLQMQTVVDELGLNKQMTIGEFYQKNKSLLPDRIKKEIEPFFMANKNMMMPSFEVISSKTTLGEDVPTLRISQNGELINIQWFGEKNRMMKFQNTTISEIDLINFDDMFTRIVAGDEKFQKQIAPVKTLKKSVGAFRSFKYPDVSRADWKTMSPKDRANYIVNMRLLYQDARAVLDQKAASKGAKKKKYSSLNIFEMNPYFTALFFENPAEAKYFTAKSCVVAGYVSTYEVEDGREVCSSKAVQSKYAGDELYKKAQANCSSSQVVCNPYIYGAPNGKGICLDPKAPNFQPATHFDGPCDTASPLQNQKTAKDFLNDPNLVQGRYDEANLKLNDKARAEFFEAEQKENKEITENFLLGILKLNGKIGADINKLDESVLASPGVLDEINKIKSEFDAKIKEATESCKQVSREGGSTEKNYWPACDQLHRRFLFIDQLSAKKCMDKGQAPTPGALTCSCPAAPVAPVVPGAPNAPVVTAPAAPPAPAASEPVRVPVQVPVPVATQPPPSSSAPAPAAPDLAPPAQSRAPVLPRPPLFSSTPPTVVPGASCPVPATTAVVPPAPAAPAGPSCGEFPTDSNCICKNGKPPTAEVTNEANDQTSYTCGDKDKKDKKDKDKDECGFFCKLWKGVKTIAPFAIAAAAAYFIFKKLAPKKPALNPAADLCPGTTTPPPCAQTCTPPLKLQPAGNCSCDGCPPGQSADATCTCSTTGGGTTPTTILCPDSVTRAANLAACPDYPCWNGSSYKNPMNCPTAPAAAPSSVNTGH